jgi:hypothetical protein
MSCSPTQWLAEPNTNMRTQARAAPSLALPSTTVSGRTHAERAVSDLNIVLTSRSHYHSGCLSPHKTSVRSPEQQPHLSCPPPQWLAKLTPTERTEARAAPSILVPAIIVTGRAHSERKNRGQRSDLTCRAQHHSDWVSPRRPSEEWPEQRTHLSCRRP